MGAFFKKRTTLIAEFYVFFHLWSVLNNIPFSLVSFFRPLVSNSKFSEFAKNVYKEEAI